MFLILLEGKTGRGDILRVLGDMLKKIWVYEKKN